MRERATPTLSAIIVDDEPLAADELGFLLKDFPDVELLDTGRNGLEALDLIERLGPDLAFLDVQMPGLDGLGVVRRLRARQPEDLPYFIFSTAFEQYAVEAFKLEALDYVLKPIDKDRLAATIERAQRYMHERQANERYQAVTENALPHSKLVVRNGPRNLIVDSAELVYATIENGIISLVTQTGEGQSNYKTLDELQANLDPAVFWRTHRSFLVNINQIREVVPWFNAGYQLRMSDKKSAEIPVSRVQTRKLRELLKL